MAIEDEIKINNNKFKEPFRPIQYLGSKLKLVNEISEIIESNKTSNTVCDIFSGSGVVSHYLANKNNVVSIDIQYYSKIITSALTDGVKFTEDEINDFINDSINNNSIFELNKIYEPLISLENKLLESKLESEIDKLKFAEFVENCSVYSYLNSDIINIKNKETSLVDEHLLKFKERFNETPEFIKNISYCSLYFGGVYFSFKQAVLIDALLFKINNLKNDNPEKYTTLLAALLSTLSEIVSTVGKQFAQPMKLTDKNNKPKNLLASRTYKDRNYEVLLIFKKYISEYSKYCFSNANNKAFAMDFNDYLNTTSDNIGCFYADPPYTIDHYSRFYHILETISLYDYPELAKMNKSNSGNVIMKGLYRLDRYQSPFCIPSKVKEAFDKLFKGTSKFNCPLLLSYSPFEDKTDNRPRLLTIDEIILLGKKYYNNIRIIELKEHKHKKLNKNENNSETIRNGEVMILFKNIAE